MKELIMNSKAHSVSILKNHLVSYVGDANKGNKNNIQWQFILHSQNGQKRKKNSLKYKTKEEDREDDHNNKISLILTWFLIARNKMKEIYKK